VAEGRVILFEAVELHNVTDLALVVAEGSEIVVGTTVFSMTHRTRQFGTGTEVSGRTTARE